MFTGSGPVLETDILALLVTTVVFLSGFSSLRLHATLGNKRRVVDDVVSSVTTTAGYADKLRWLDFAVSNAANAPEWQHAASQLRSEEDPALSDRDLRTARPTFPRRTSPWRFDELDRVTAATLGLVLLVLATLGALLVGALISGTSSGRWTAVIAFAAASLVAAVALLDVRSVATEYDQLAAVLSLQGPTVTEWWASGGAMDGIQPWSTVAALIERPDDATRAGALPDETRTRYAADLMPEWSTPHALTAYQRRQQMVADCSGPPVIGSSDPRMADALAHAQRAVLLNPLDPGCRVVLAALIVDQLAADLRSALAAGGGDALLQELPLSDVLSRDPDADLARPMRWRFSLALRRAREASILVERRWGAIDGRRSAGGRLTQLDRIAVDYLLGRAYLLSGCHQPASQLSRANAGSAVKHLLLAQRGRDGIELLNTHRCAEWPVTWQELGYLPSPLCDDPILVRTWWHDAADRLVSHDATDEFADLWTPT